jgi:hypothetical protein
MNASQNHCLTRLTDLKRGIKPLKYLYNKKHGQWLLPIVRAQRLQESSDRFVIKKPSLEHYFSLTGWVTSFSQEK